MIIILSLLFKFNLLLSLAPMLICRTYGAQNEFSLFHATDISPLWGFKSSSLFLIPYSLFLIPYSLFSA